MDDFVERMYKLGLHDGLIKTFKAIKNITASLEAEGFKFTTEDYELLERVVVKEEISIDDAIKEILQRYRTN